MQNVYPKTVIYRHCKENLKKCSLSGLESREDMEFYLYPKQKLPPLPNYILLSMNAPLLSESDVEHGLLILDGTWRNVEKMQRMVDSSFIPRSLPPELRTAYPRRQEDCSDPERGLASIEAIYVSYILLGRNPQGLLDRYRWKDLFLEMNFSLLSPYLNRITK